MWCCGVCQALQAFFHHNPNQTTTTTPSFFPAKCYEAVLFCVGSEGRVHFHVPTAERSSALFPVLEELTSLLLHCSLFFIFEKKKTIAKKVQFGGEGAL